MVRNRRTWKDSLCVDIIIIIFLEGPIMNATIRSAGRSSSILIGTVALAFSLGACSGSEEPPAEETAAEEETTEEMTQEETTEEDTAEETTEEEMTEEEAGGAAADVTEEDLSAAKGQFIGFVQALGEKDATKACGFMIDPSTGEPVADENLETCASTLESSGMMDTFTPEMAGMISEDMLTATANDDGTITLDLSGSELKMVKASDDKWYFTN